MFSIKFSWFVSFKSWLILLVIFERLDSCLPVIVSPWQIINLESHFSDIGFAMFLGIVLSLVSRATCTSPPRKEFVTTLANAGLGRIISGLFKTIFALIEPSVNKMSSIDDQETLNDIKLTINAARSISTKIDDMSDDFEKLTQDKELTKSIRDLTIGLSKFLNEIYP